MENCYLKGLLGQTPRCGNLQLADIAMGEEPFKARRGKSKAILSGQRCLSGIREVWVRDSYLGKDFLSIAPDVLVVDLGVNMGNFTLLALGHGRGVKVIAVEPSRLHLKKLK